MQIQTVIVNESINREKKNTENCNYTELCSHGHIFLKMTEN